MNTENITTIQIIQIQAMFGIYFTQLIFPEVYQEVYSIIQDPQLPSEYIQYLLDSESGIEILIITDEPLYKQIQWVNTYFIEYVIIDKHFNPVTNTSYIQIKLKEEYK